MKIFIDENQILKNHRKTTKPSEGLKRIHFIWIARDIKQFTLFSNTLCDLNQMVREKIFHLTVLENQDWFNFIPQI